MAGRILSGSSLGFTARSLRCCPWWPVQEGGGCEQGLAPQTGERLTGVRVPQPRLHAAAC